MDEKNENECENQEKAGDKSSLSLYFSLCLCDHKGRKSNFYKDLERVIDIDFKKIDTKNKTT